MKKNMWILLCVLMLGQSGVWANEVPKPPSQKWSFSGAFGTYDRPSVRRGLQVYREVCAACHGMNHLRYEKLKALGFTESDVKAIAAEYEVAGTVADDGQPTKRKAEPKDFFAHPFPTEAAAREANNGAFPVDLSMVVKARPHGPDYVYGLLTGYTQMPAGMHMASGMHYNKYFPGNQIAMAPPLISDGQVTYPDGTKATIHQMAHDVVTFLAWASEPEMEKRKHMGVVVLIFLGLFTVMMGVLTRRIWWNVKHPS
ncbi:MAG: cytochrome c1 [Alphaproteobacteria bacterium]|nr:cytochrome c1 [Alphaproteobacteria bacterium]